eukprot:TRINITY_DN897_c0_g4_i1.p1 TRINITY_DN897_c0_g4~~TRINITY_DN897_c0_g4_i1.p1  ORF type:complete len:416 (+),score=71.82 TRINITY_DN897_c0_g4_i1:29-1249(+)
MPSDPTPNGVNVAGNIIPRSKSSLKLVVGSVKRVDGPALASSKIKVRYGWQEKETEIRSVDSHGSIIWNAMLLFDVTFKDSDAMLLELWEGSEMTAHSSIEIPRSSQLSAARSIIMTTKVPGITSLSINLSVSNKSTPTKSMLREKQDSQTDSLQTPLSLNFDFAFQIHELKAAQDEFSRKVEELEASAEKSRQELQRTSSSLQKKAQDASFGQESTIRRLREEIASLDKSIKESNTNMHREIHELSAQVEDWGKRTLCVSGKIGFLETELGRTIGKTKNSDSSSAIKFDGFFALGIFLPYAVKGAYAPLYLVWETLMYLSVVRWILVFIGSAAPDIRTDQSHVDNRDKELTKPEEKPLSPGDQPLAPPDLLSDVDEKISCPVYCLLDDLDKHCGLRPLSSGSLSD